MANAGRNRDSSSFNLRHLRKSHCIWEKGRTMEAAAETRPRNRQVSRSSFACARCKKAKRRCDIAQQTGPGKSCSACRQRNEPCDSRQRGEDKRSRRERQNTAGIRERLANLESEIQGLSAHKSCRAEDRPFSQSTSQAGSTLGQSIQQLQGSPVAVLAQDCQDGGSSRRTPSVTSGPQLGFQAADARSESHTSSAPSTRSFDRVKSTSQDLKLFPTGMDEVTPPSNVLKGSRGRNKRYFGASSIFPYGEATHHLHDTPWQII